ncbi:MAG TPA: NAD-dependent protein deacylase, partial [Proteobacteria bacterium]|nr:NAD-dependent protein deacylase [Pseudomonadota bacterium]
GRLVENFELPLKNRRCHGEHYWRPDIVWFGDPLREENIREAVAAMESCDLFISIGTSAVVYPAAHLPLIAMKNGARTIEINPEETPLSSEYQEIYRQPASKALAEIFPEIR